jgi:anti-sigma-K factor RskA
MEQVGAHVADCEECQEDIARMRPAAVAIGLAGADVAAPAGMRERILQRARETPAEVESPAIAAMARGVRKPRLYRVPSRFPIQAVAAVVAVALVAGAVAGAVGGRLVSGPPPAEVARFQLGGHGNMTGATAEVVDLRNEGIAFVTFSHLPAPPDGKVYELWLIKASTAPVDVGVFVPDADGGKTVLVAQAISGYTTMAVTAEAAPDGAPAPTQQPELYGSVS